MSIDRAYDEDSYQEKIAEAAENFEECVEDFARWCETVDGREAFKEFKTEVLQVPAETAEELDNERFKVFFEFVINQTHLLDKWVEWYRSMWPESFKEYNTPDEADE